MSNIQYKKRINRVIRHRRIRAKIRGTATRPRLAVFRSNKHMHLQLVDDTESKTLAASSTVKGQNAVEILTKRAEQLGIKQVVFDRGGFQYHGKVAKIADEIRKAGLIF